VLIALVGLPGAFAQTTTHYVDPAAASTATDCTDQTNGCTLTAALGAASHGDILSSSVHRVGGEVRIPGGPYSIGDSVTFSAHLQSGGTGMEGTVEFTGDDPVTIDDGG